jgi:hypothetical protein
MLRAPSHPRLLSSADPAHGAILRAFAPLTKTASISTPQRALNWKSNRNIQAVHSRDIGGASPTQLAPILVRPLAAIQYP